MGRDLDRSMPTEEIYSKSPGTWGRTMMKQVTSRRWSFIVMSAALVLLTLVFLASGDHMAAGRTITVDDDGEAEFTRIQDAINASEEGDIIRVSAGVYRENILINRTLTMTGDGPADTFIDGEKRDHTVLVTADRVNISGFSIINSGTRGSTSGLRIDSDNNHIFDNVLFNNREGIQVTSAYNIIENNSCYGNENGLYLSTAEFNQFHNNSCFLNEENGAQLSSSTDNIFTGNTFSDNKVGMFLWIYSWDNTANYNNIYDNIQYGIDASDNHDYSIDAAHTWWGHGSGPFHSSQNTGGTGDNVSANVEFDPWLDELPGTMQGVSGHVRDNDSGEPLDDAVIRIRDQDRNCFYEAHTNESGFFEKSLPLAGSYELIAEYDWYRLGSQVLTVTGGEREVAGFDLGKDGRTQDNRTIWNVDDDAPDGGIGSIERPFRTIQEAVDVAENGDTVLVHEGIYPENVDVDKALNLVGSDRDTTIV